ncbi:hypothetical protein BDB01DRAFT_836886 [Pilobolus umbonatus]|nr:hypothetical protein BDB01DRAFT_836886 [Pilobolus umbonatus]
MSEKISLMNKNSVLVSNKRNCSTLSGSIQLNYVKDWANMFWRKIHAQVKILGCIEYYQFKYYNGDGILWHDTKETLVQHISSNESINMSSTLYSFESAMEEN